MAANSMHSITSSSISWSSARRPASKDAVSLPIKLAVALLKDRNGVIDLNLPSHRLARRSEISLGPHHLEGVRQHLGKGGHRAVRAARARCSAGGPASAVRRISTRRARLDPAAVGQGQSHGQGAGGAAAAEDRGADRGRAATRSTAPRRRRSFSAQLRNELQTLTSARKKSAGAARQPPTISWIPAPSWICLTEALCERMSAAEPKVSARRSNATQAEAGSYVSAKIDFLTKELREHLAVGDADLNGARSAARHGACSKPC